MPAKRKPEAQTRTAQVSVRVDAQLYEKYKTKLKAEGISVTEDLETHMRAFIGEVMVQNNVVDITQVIEDVENLKKAMGELKPDWQKRTPSLKAS